MTNTLACWRPPIAACFLQLKYVSEETTKLEHWRSSFLEALKDYGDRAMTRATFQVSAPSDEMYIDEFRVPCFPCCN